MGWHRLCRPYPLFRPFDPPVQEPLDHPWRQQDQSGLRPGDTNITLITFVTLRPGGPSKHPARVIEVRAAINAIEMRMTDAPLKISCRRPTGLDGKQIAPPNIQRFRPIVIRTKLAAVVPLTSVGPMSAAGTRSGTFSITTPPAMRPKVQSSCWTPATAWCARRSPC